MRGIKHYKSVVTGELNYCADCGSCGSWERYPERDIHFITGDKGAEVIGRIFEYAYKCVCCGRVTFYPYAPELTIKGGKSNG